MNTNTPPENPPAFPFVGNPDVFQINQGMTLRDFFATKAAGDEICAISYHHLSTFAQEQMIGREFPREDTAASPATYQVERAKFYIDVSAKLRFMFADAMLLARTGNGGEE